ncbi:MAG TPA: membrane protein, partial [Corynebacterium sp.]|nr:membrane protein [Corynebacterium sp.]
RVLVSYKGRVGYAPTISEALAQVGIDPRAAQDIAGSEATPAPETPDTTDDTEADETEAAETPTPPASGTGTEGEAIDRINEALRKLETARDGSFEEYGKALDELDRAVAEYRSTN